MFADPQLNISSNGTIPENKTGNYRDIPGNLQEYTTGNYRGIPQVITGAYPQVITGAYPHLYAPHMRVVIVGLRRQEYTHILFLPPLHDVYVCMYTYSEGGRTSYMRRP